MIEGSMMAQTGLHPFPVGTLEEVRAAGLDPSQVGSCAPPSPGVRGCPWAAPGRNGEPPACIFHMRRYGGFKGKAVKNVGVYIRTDAADGHRQQQMSMSCHNFIRTLKGRMLHGEWHRNQGLDGETIRIIAQEGELIYPVEWVMANEADPKSMFVRRTGPNGERYSREVPRHPKPGELDISQVDAVMWAEEMERRRIESGEFLPPAEMTNPDDDEPFVMDGDVGGEPLEEVDDAPSA